MESSPVGELTREAASCRQLDCVLGLCTQTLVNPFLDQRVIAVRSRGAQIVSLARLCASLDTPTLANQLLDQRVSWSSAGAHIKFPWYIFFPSTGSLDINTLDHMKRLKNIIKPEKTISSPSANM